MIVICVFSISLRYDMCLREPLLLNCCFLLCRGDVQPMDLISVTTSPAPSNNSHDAAPGRLFSFLSVAWGFVSDVDIESERCVFHCLHLKVGAPCDVAWKCCNTWLHSHWFPVSGIVAWAQLASRWAPW